MLGLICAVGQALVIVLNRTLKETPAPVIVFHYTILGLTFGFAYILIELLLTGEGSRFSQYTLR